MNEIISIDWAIILMGLIALLLVFIIVMLREVIQLLTEFQDRPGLTATSKTTDYSSLKQDIDCTEEELAVITAVLAKLLPDEKFNIVNLKLVQ